MIPKACGETLDAVGLQRRPRWRRGQSGTNDEKSREQSFVRD
jgi:hypothetical protein